MSIEVKSRDASLEMAEFLTQELSEVLDGRSKLPAARQNPASGPAVAEMPARLPRRIEGGFAGLGLDLDQHGRECRNAVRLMERLRPPVEAAEVERVRLQEMLARILPKIEEDGRGLAAMIDTTRKGDVSGDLAAKFKKSASKLDELERIAEALNSNLMAMVSAWEQYARAAIQAQRLRDTYKSH